MVGKRHYDDPCGLARALEVVGERWALLVVRELLLGPKRFSDLARGLAGVSENVLSTRLRELEAAGVVVRYSLGPPASTRVYGLTPRGAELEPAVLALSRWGGRTAATSSQDLSVDALMLALKTTFAPDRDPGLAATLELGVDHDTFTAAVAAGRFTLTRGPRPHPDAVLSTDSRTLRALVFDGASLDQALIGGNATLVGHHDTAARFLRCFPRPTTETQPRRADGEVASE